MLFRFCTDSTSHLDTLSGIAETLLAEEKMEEISRAESAEEVLRIMSGETDVPA